MGTRGFIGFVVDGTEKIAYNHFDSYPSGLGLDVLKWLRKEHVGYIARKAADLRVVDPNSTPTAEDIERLQPYANTGVSTQRIDEWYVLLHGTQGNPAAMLEAGVIEDASEFPADSLYAEWGYVVDLDAQTFEAYQGFQHSAHDKGRFAARPKLEYKGPSNDYYPVALVGSWPLSALPTDDEFLKIDASDEGE